jgi:ABC-type cobalamin/Fe3+-siderophores transport system ATPase subunit
MHNGCLRRLLCSFQFTRRKSIQRNCIFLPQGSVQRRRLRAHDFVAFGDHLFDNQLQVL